HEIDDVEEPHRSNDRSERDSAQPEVITESGHGSFILPGHALLRPRCTRAPLPRSTVPPPVCTCAAAAEHCTTSGVHVRHCRGTLHHLRCTRAPLPRCTTPGVRVRHCRAALHHLGCTRAPLPRCTA